MDVSSLQAFSVEAVAAVAVGLLFMILVLVFLEKVMPFSLKTAISGKRNDAVSVILFSVLLGLTIIISSSLRPEAAAATAPAASASASAGAAPLRSSGVPAVSAAPRRNPPPSRSR
jgi:uncharacterized membrane protein YjfL (UPF0719 family)